MLPSAFLCLTIFTVFTSSKYINRQLNLTLAHSFGSQAPTEGETHLTNINRWQSWQRSGLQEVRSRITLPPIPPTTLVNITLQQCPKWTSYPKCDCFYNLQITRSENKGPFFNKVLAKGKNQMNSLCDSDVGRLYSVFSTSQCRDGAHFIVTYLTWWEC